MVRSWLHRLEIAHWQRETRRVTHAFAWGVEHLGGDPSEASPLEFLLRYAGEAQSSSDDFFDVGPAERYELDNGYLRYPSAVRSPFPENNTVWSRWFPARQARGRAVLVLPQWNAQPDSHVAICRWLSRAGVSALRLSLPYHDQRRPEEFERADPLVSPNIGLTLQGNRQAVQDVRRGIRWLEEQGYDRVGILGTSLGSCIAFITMAHDPALRAGAFLHVSTQFGDVVRTGLTTRHVWDGLREHVDADQIRRIWQPISPFGYVSRLRDGGRKMLLVSARYDLSFPPELSRQLWEEMDRQGVPYEKLVLPCGHYTLGHFPFSWLAAFRAVTFLRRHLSDNG